MSTSSTCSPASNKKRRAEDGAPIRGSGDTDGETHKDILLEGAKAVILRCLQTESKDFWDKLPMEWKLDREVAKTMLKYGEEGSMFDDLPPRFQNDRGFLLDAVNEDSYIWFQLPDALKNDIDFAKGIACFTADELPAALFENFPELCNDRNFWLAIFDAASCLSVYSLVYRYAPDAIRSDYEIMLKACAAEPIILQNFVGANLSENRDFLEELLTLKPRALESMPPTSMQMFSELVIRFLPKVLLTLSNHRSKHFAKRIPADLWRNNRDIVLTWFKSGGRFFDIARMEHLKGDKEIFLLIAKHFPKERKFRSLVDSFKLALPALTSDKEFMLQAIALNPDIYHTASAELKKDFDVWLTAFGGTPGKFPAVNEENWTGLRGTVADFISCVETELQNHQTFVCTLLFGMNQQSGSALHLLNQGEPTALNYKRLIAVYLEVPTGKRLHQLRTATTNLASVLKDVARFP